MKSILTSLNEVTSTTTPGAIRVNIPEDDEKNPTDNTKPTSFSSPDPNKGNDGELTWKQRLSNSMSDVGHKISDNSGKIAGASALAAAGGLGYLAYKKMRAKALAKK